MSIKDDKQFEKDFWKPFSVVSRKELKPDTKKISFTDWVLEQQEMLEEQILDQDVDELSIREEQAITDELLNRWGNR